MNKKMTFFDEMLSGQGSRAPYDAYAAWFETQNTTRLANKAQEAEAFFRSSGITFNVYGQSDAEERLIPFDLVPRILSNNEWSKLSKELCPKVGDGLK